MHGTEAPKFSIFKPHFSERLTFRRTLALAHDRDYQVANGSRRLTRSMWLTDTHAHGDRGGHVVEALT